MAKRKRKNRYEPKMPIASLKAVSPELFPTSPLDILAERRTGGSESIKGFVFQCNYAAWKILSHLTVKSLPEVTSIRLEGIEDIDVSKVSIKDGASTEFIQVKHSIDRLGLGTLWQRSVFQNFVETYLLNSQSRFRLVHSAPLAKGRLSSLAEANQEGSVLTSADLNYWREKFDELRQQDSAKDWNWSLFDLPDFLSRISFELVSESFLLAEALHLLITNHQVESGNEKQYLHALYWATLIWSRDRKAIRYSDLVQLIESVREDIARGPITPAVQARWLTKVAFEVSKKKDASSYFEGKSARPHHIAAGLPAHRDGWEQEILQVFRSSDVTVIRASSGQGKSTLAWQVALTLTRQGWSPYELHWCGDAKEIGNIITFIESRIKIGELPLVIIDGLSATVSEWAELAKRTLELPIKFIVTTREEDWYRFGADRSQLRLKPVSLEMGREEANNIFLQFQKAGKLHSSITNWQSAWEKVANRGLLIEYVYLLTQGQMIEERISSQIRWLVNDRDGAAKIEILRLVSVADICGVRLPTSPLITLIQNRIGFQGDRGEVLRSLQREYYIQLEERVYVEGLHPVRSQHIVKHVHDTIPLVETLMNLLQLIELDSLRNFSAQAPLLIEGQQRILFLKNLAEYFARRPYLEMVQVIDGLFSTDALQHWKQNQKIYDEIFARGVGLFSMDAFPWSGLNTLKELSKSITGEPKENVDTLSSIVDKIVPFDPPKSDTLIFVKTLSSFLAQEKLNDDFRGLGRLIKWFLRFEVECPTFTRIDQIKLWQAFQTLELEEAGELLSTCYETRPDIYQAILSQHKPEIIGRLKRETNTLTIREDGQNLQIEYFVEFNRNDGKSVNDQSVDRINIIGSFFPLYERYCTEGLRPPIPGLEYTNKYDNSIKRMLPEYVNQFFKVHVNRIWLDSISLNYTSPSVYDWQKHWYDIRVRSLELVIILRRIFEALLEGDNKKVKSTFNKLDGKDEEFFRLSSGTIEFPKRGDKIFNSEQFGQELKILREWLSNWHNFLRQAHLVTQPKKPNDRYIANMNMQETRQKLGKMQDAYDFITTNTFPYFDVTELRKEEIVWYGHLAKVVNFCVSVPDRIGRTPNPRNTVPKWWDQQEKNRLEGIKKALAALEEVSDFKGIVPTHTIKTNNLRRTTIGIRGLRWKQLEDEPTVLKIIISLVDLADLDIDFFSIVAIVEDHPENSLALSISKTFLERARESLISGKELEQSDFEKPHPDLVSPEMLEVLPGISMPNMEVDIVASSIGDILWYLWRLSETRKRLSKEESTELNWLHELEEHCKQELAKALTILESQASETLVLKYQNIIKSVTENEAPFTSEAFRQLFMEDIQSRVTESDK